MKSIKTARNFKEIAEYLDESNLLADVANTMSDQYGLMLFPDGHIMNDNCKYLDLSTTRECLMSTLKSITTVK